MIKRALRASLVLWPRGARVGW